MAIGNIKLRASTTAVTNLRSNVDATITVKSSPLTHEEVDLNFLEVAEAIKNKSISPLTANLDASTKSITNLGNLTIGTSTVSGVLTANHANLTNSPITVRTGLTGNDMYSSLRVKSKRQSASDMGDNFGSSVSFQIEDDGATGDLGYLGFKRAGADNTGKFSINVYSTGTPAEKLTLDASGVLTVSGVVATTFTGSLTGTASSIANHNTGSLAEGSNLYFTNARADARIAAASINALSDVNTSGAANGKILKYNGTAWVIADDSTATDISSNTITQLSDVNITSVANNQVLKYDSSSSKWINSATPITAGSIGTTELATNIPLTTFTDSGNTFAKSTLAADITGNSKNITGVANISATGNIAVSGNVTVTTNLVTNGTTTLANVSYKTLTSNVDTYTKVGRYQRHLTTGLSGYYSSLILEAKAPSAVSDGFGPVLDFKISDDNATSSSLGYLGFVRDGADNSGKMVVYAEKAGTASEVLSADKDGKVALNGGPLLLGNMTTTQRDALTAANGMIIYNTTDNKFQGYENGSWVNLI